MIFETLQVIKEEVNSYFGGSIVSLENIATIDTDPEGGGGDTSDVILSLINLQEEFTLKNISNNYTNNTEVNYRNPKVNLNLYILFSSTNTLYEESLKNLTKVVEFFQGKKVFTQDNTSFERVDDMVNVGDFKFIADLYTPSFEELNFIWGTLGGKQYPSAIYKITLLEIYRDFVFEKGTVITGLNNGLKNK
jgi:hypothetical protein